MVAMAQRHNSLADSADHRAAKIRVPRGGTLAGSPERPIWIRYPRDGSLCPWTGLTRFKLRELTEPTDERPKPPVRSVSMPNEGGNKRNVRLIHLQSLLDYLESLPAAVAADSAA
jgi:hypothetical protein